MLASAADLMDQGQLVNRLSIAVTAIAAAVMLLPVFPVSAAMAPVAVVVALFGLGELALAMRVSLDAAFFRRLAADAAADRLDIAAFDQALAGLGLISRRKAGRPMTKRFAAAKGLLAAQSAMLILQILAAVAGAAGIFFELV
jgi:hypothetical protein